MGLKTYGTMAVDWEERINFERLRKERLEIDALFPIDRHRAVCF